MDFTPLLIFLGLMAAACSHPVKKSWSCEKPCLPVDAHCFKPQTFKHVSDLNNSSVAPWKIEPSTEESHFPTVIDNATCTKCNIENMTPKPILLQIWIFKMARNSTNHTHWCTCPVNLAVGCTCVNK